MSNRTLLASALLLMAGSASAADYLPTDLSSYVPSVSDEILKNSPLQASPVLGAELSLPVSTVYLQGHLSQLDPLDAERAPRFIDTFSQDVAKYSVGLGIRRPLSERFDVSASVDMVRLDYTNPYAYAALTELGSDTGKSFGLGLSGQATDALELGAQWSTTRYDGDPLQRAYNNVDLKATYRFTPNFGLFTQYGLSDDLNGDGAMDDQYRIGGSVSF